MNRSQFIRILLLAPLGGQRIFACGEPEDFSSTIKYLLKRQSPDGAWRSNVYGAFKDGRALTPIVLRALSLVPDPALEGPRNKAIEWLLNRGGDLMADFPVHIASAILETSVRLKGLKPLREKAISRLLELEVPFGGWSYSPLPPPPPGPGRYVLPPMQQPNLSATTLALDGLHAAGVELKSRKMHLEFIKQCQNFASLDQKFDDGGFFQMPNDPSRNKAGIAGKQSNGVTRFNSYAAATSDGLRALLICGEPNESERFVSAQKWLERFTWSPTSTPKDLSYYTSRSFALTFIHTGFSIKSGHALALESAFGFHNEIVELRRPDGSWLNPAGEMRENAPLVATSLALEACLLHLNKTDSAFITNRPSSSDN